MAYAMASSTVAPSSCTSVAPLSSYSASIKGAPRVGLPAPVLAQAPTSPAAPPPPSGHPGVGPLTPAPRWTLGPAQARSALLFHPSYAAALVVTTAQAARRPYIHLGGSSLKIYALHPKHGSRSQSL